MKYKTKKIIVISISSLLLISGIIFGLLITMDYGKQQQIKIDCRGDFARQYCLQINSELVNTYINYEFTCVDINKRIAKNIRYKLLQSEIDHCDNQEVKQ